MTQMIARLRHDDVPPRRRAEGARRGRRSSSASTARSPTDARPRRCWPSCARASAGRAWIADLESRKHPWFFMSTGDGFYHHHRAWADDLRLPFTAITGLHRADPGEGASLERPQGAAARRARADRRRSTPSCSRPTRSARSSRRCSASAATCSRTRRATSSSSSTGAPRSSSTRCARSAPCCPSTASSRSADDIFYLNIHEVHEALSDLGLAWSGGSAGARHGLLAAAVARRKEILARLARVDAAAGARRRARGDQRPDRAAPLGRDGRAAARVGEPGRATSDVTRLRARRPASSRASRASSATSNEIGDGADRARCSSARSRRRAGDRCSRRSRPPSPTSAG